MFAWRSETERSENIWLGTSQLTNSHWHGKASRLATDIIYWTTSLNVSELLKQCSCREPSKSFTARSNASTFLSTIFEKFPSPETAPTSLIWPSCDPMAGKSLYFCKLKIFPSASLLFPISCGWDTDFCFVWGLKFPRKDLQRSLCDEGLDDGGVGSLVWTDCSVCLPFGSSSGLVGDIIDDSKGDIHVNSDSTPLVWKRE